MTTETLDQSLTRLQATALQVKAERDALLDALLNSKAGANWHFQVQMLAAIKAPMLLRALGFLCDFGGAKLGILFPLDTPRLSF